MATITAQQEGPAWLVSPEAVAALGEVFRGELIGVADPGYDAARRVWNGNIDRRPGLAARCRGVADVGMRLASRVRHGLLVSVRGGGQSAPRLRHQRWRPGH